MSCVGVHSIEEFTNSFRCLHHLCSTIMEIAKTSHTIKEYNLILESLGIMIATGCCISPDYCDCHGIVLGQQRNRACQKMLFTRSKTQFVHVFSSVY